MIIGIHGKARSGKDLFGEYLIEGFDKMYHRNFHHMSFANQLKNMCKDHFDLSDAQLWEQGENIREIPDKRFLKVKGIGSAIGWNGLPKDDIYWTPREIMQELGSFYRKIDYDYWVKSLAIESVRKEYKDVIITDVRHVNECEYVKINKGMLVKIVRPETQSIHGMQHESETALDDRPEDYFDITVHNSGTLDDLYNAAEHTVAAIINVERMINKGETYNGRKSSK